MTLVLVGLHETACGTTQNLHTSPTFVVRRIDETRAKTFSSGPVTLQSVCLQNSERISGVRLRSSHRLLLCLTRRAMHVERILRRINATIVAVEKNYLSSSRVCRLTYPARNAHAPKYIVMCGPSGCTVFFPHTTFGKENSLLTKLVF